MFGYFAELKRSRRSVDGRLHDDAAGGGGGGAGGGGGGGEVLPAPRHGQG